MNLVTKMRLFHNEGYERQLIARVWRISSMAALNFILRAKYITKKQNSKQKASSVKTVVQCYERTRANFCVLDSPE